MHSEDRFSHNWLAKKLVNDKVRQNASRLRGIVIDLGCGNRPYEADILARADVYIGVDWTRTYHGLHADVVADIGNTLPFRNDSADCVVAFEVLEHVPEPAFLLSESARILTPGGLVMLSVPFQWWVHEEPWDFFRYTRHGLEYLLQQAGFVDIVVTPTSGFWSMLILKLNYQLARLARGPLAVRKLLRALLVPIWWAGQSLAPLLDRVWREDRETCGYFVTARKP